MKHIATTALLVSGLAAALFASCAGTSEPASATLPVSDPAARTALADDALVLAWTETGGCGMIRPDCPRHDVLADGTVHTFRVGEPERVSTGRIDPFLVETWIEVARGTDVMALLERLGPGEETAPFDGVDYRLDAPLVGLTLSSAEKAFDPEEPFFAAALDVVRAAQEAAPLPAPADGR